MRLVGLTGGIGAGKSTVSAALAARGAVIVDADQVARDVQAPGSPVLEKMVERFGPHVLADDGSLDRAAVTAIVFSDAESLAALNAIVGPELKVITVNSGTLNLDGLYTAAGLTSAGSRRRRPPPTRAAPGTKD